jgi:hypothetical protein
VTCPNCGGETLQLFRTSFGQRCRACKSLLYTAKTNPGKKFEVIIINNHSEVVTAEVAEEIRKLRETLKQVRHVLEFSTMRTAEEWATHFGLRPGFAELFRIVQHDAV